MGGYGSGRHWGFTKRLVEDSYTLSIKTILPHIKDVANEGYAYYGSLYWSIGGKQTANISYQVVPGDNVPKVRLIYQTTSRAKNEVIKSDYFIQLQTTFPHFGGTRYWFTCPLIVNGKPCKKRVAKLYLPPGSTYFGCRKCHDLTYQSCNESHKWDNLFLSLGFDPSVEKLLRNRRNF